jgi:D-inositol-3-phosphate glycosyltransferase
VVCVPSYNESFGLVALEAQACGTPVVAANVGGLPTAVRDGVSGFLVDGHCAGDYAAVVERLVGEPRLLARLGAAGVQHAASFGWDRTADQTLVAYQEARQFSALKPMAAAQ